MKNDKNRPRNRPDPQENDSTDDGRAIIENILHALGLLAKACFAAGAGIAGALFDVWDNNTNRNTDEGPDSGGAKDNREGDKEEQKAEKH